MSIKLRFACGHEGTVSETAETAPVCACGETRVARTFARAPRFRGACSGPYAETVALDAVAVDLTSAGSLKLKPQE